MLLAGGQLVTPVLSQEDPPFDVLTYSDLPAGAPAPSVALAAHLSHERVAFLASHQGCVMCAAVCFAAGLVLNSIVVTQILVYGNRGVAAKKVKGKAAVKKAA